MMMGKITSSTRIIGRIQRLCCFGPGGLAFVPELMRELGSQVPSERGPTFLRQGDDYRTTNIYTNDGLSLAAMQLYVRDFEEGEAERAVAWSDGQVISQYLTSPVHEYSEWRVKVSRSEWLRSELYGALFRTAAVDRYLISALVSRHPRPIQLGSLVLPRTAAERAFNRKEIRLLEAVAPFVVHALAEQRPMGPHVDTEERAMLIVDEKGAVQHVSSEARRLLVLTHFPIAGSALPDGLPDQVVQLCRQVAAWSENKPLTSPPVWRVKNDWGEFVFRVYRMEQYAALPTARLLGVGIERREPLRLRLLRKIDELPLSSREIELSLALLDGNSRGDVAARLGISESTAISHCRNLYNKLNVHSRIGLVEKLRSL